jgi:lipopolysaccharide transport system ATP-binding protein
MNAAAIQVEGLSKCYRIGQRQASYRTFRETLVDLAVAPFRRVRNSRRADPEIWALRDLSFELQQGEVLGIVGRNGAGKSTLLKILSRITEPTSGRALIHGRVGSLLDVGIGFHPELTGRENIYLDGAILGMRREEIGRKFDEIVAFAELEKFLETPVKRYSSGMWVRLAFAVAAHLEPEILLMDEVLAFGDASFQKKCLGKMGEVGKHGRTILFVSHQLNQIRRLCGRVLWLDSGQLRQMGATADVVTAYEADATSSPRDSSRPPGDERLAARFLRWEIVEPRNEQPNVVATLDAVTFRVLLQVNKPFRSGHHGIELFNRDETLVWAAAAQNLRLDAGLRELVYRLPTLPLKPGVYYWQVSIWEGADLVDSWRCVPEMVIATLPLTDSSEPGQGVLNLPWELEIK